MTDRGEFRKYWKKWKRRRRFMPAPLVRKHAEPLRKTYLARITGTMAATGGRHRVLPAGMGGLRLFLLARSGKTEGRRARRCGSDWVSNLPNSRTGDVKIVQKPLFFHIIYLKSIILCNLPLGNKKSVYIFSAFQIYKGRRVCYHNKLQCSEKRGCGRQWI